MELQVRNIQGALAGSIEVREDVFGAKVNQDLIHQVLVSQLANRRQGTAKAKTRAEVSGGGAKPRPQKGTGRARAGSTRSPIWKGGGVTFGPSPRSYRHNTPKQMRRGALISTLSGKAREGGLVVIDDFDIPDNKTSSVVQALRALGADRSVMLVADGAPPETLRAARNVPKLKMAPSHTLNTVDLLNHHRVIMTVQAVRNAESIWGGRFERRPSVDVVAELPTDEAQE